MHRFSCFVVLAFLLAGCIVHEQRETVAINGSNLAGSQIPPGQPLKVALTDGSQFDATFVSLSKTELVTRRRRAVTVEEVHTPVANVSAVAYYRVIGTRVEAIPLPLPTNFPINMGGIHP